MTRKFRSYRKYIELHKQLRDAKSLDECAKMSRELIDNYMDNRMIWDELNYYKQHHALLGKHPAFEEFKRRKDLHSMSVKQLLKRKQQILDNIWRVTSEMKKGDKPHLNTVRQNRLEGYQRELADINKVLDE